MESNRTELFYYGDGHDLYLAIDLEELYNDWGRVDGTDSIVNSQSIQLTGQEE